MARLRQQETPMSPIALLDAGRSLADRIPQSFLSAVARVAAATVFWRSGQTKVEGFHLNDTALYLFREEYKVPLLPPDVAAELAHDLATGFRRPILHLVTDERPR
jgi:hypothetical protein